MIECEIKLFWNNFETISVFYFTCNHGITVVWRTFVPLLAVSPTSKIAPILSHPARLRDTIVCTRYLVASPIPHVYCAVFVLVLSHATDFIFPTPTHLHHFYRSSICEGGLGSRNSVCLSVRLSVTRVDYDKTKWPTTDFFISHERAITLLIWHQQWLVGDAPFPLKSALKVTHPLSKNADFDRFPLITLSLIHIWRCRRIERCRSRWSPYH